MCKEKIPVNRNERLKRRKLFNSVLLRRDLEEMKRRMLDIAGTTKCSHIGSHCSVKLRMETQSKNREGNLAK